MAAEQKKGGFQAQSRRRERMVESQSSVIQKKTKRCPTFGGKVGRRRCRGRKEVGSQRKSCHEKRPKKEDLQYPLGLCTSVKNPSKAFESILLEKMRNPRRGQGGGEKGSVKERKGARAIGGKGGIMNMSHPKERGKVSLSAYDHRRQLRNRERESSRNHYTTSGKRGGSNQKKKGCGLEEEKIENLKRVENGLEKWDRIVTQRKSRRYR